VGVARDLDTAFSSVNALMKSMRRKTHQLPVVALATQRWNQQVKRKCENTRQV
jgi:hypothetical protein